MSLKSLSKSAKNNAKLSEHRDRMLNTHKAMLYTTVLNGRGIINKDKASLDKVNKSIDKHVDSLEDVISEHTIYGYKYGKKEAYTNVALMGLVAGCYAVVKHRQVIGLYTKQQLQKLKNMFKKEPENYSDSF